MELVESVKMDDDYEFQTYQIIGPFADNKRVVCIGFLT